MTKIEMRNSIKTLCGVRWLNANTIENDFIDDQIIDEIEELVGATRFLEGEYTGTASTTNNYLEINENIMIVRRVHYDYTANEDLGAFLDEVTPLSNIKDHEKVLEFPVAS